MSDKLAKLNEEISTILRDSFQPIVLQDTLQRKASCGGSCGTCRCGKQAATLQTDMYRTLRSRENIQAVRDTVRKYAQENGLNIPVNAAADEILDRAVGVEVSPDIMQQILVAHTVGEDHG